MVKVGYLFSKAKLTRLGLLELVKECKEGDEYDFVEIDPRITLFEQGHQDIKILIHRLHDYVILFPEINLVDYIQTLKYEVEKYGIIMIGGLDIIETLADRTKSLALLKDLERFTYQEFRVVIPTTFDLEKGSSKDEISSILAEINPMFLAKSTGEAFVSEFRYKMTIYFNKNEKSLLNLVEFSHETKLAIQKFYNHNGTLYKLFILGDRWQISMRKSIRNFDSNETQEPLSFMSNTISKSNSKSELHAEAEDLSNYDFDENCIESLVLAIKKYINCPLLGIDLIIQDKTKNIVIVDVNYFPGYEGFSKKYHLGESFIKLLKSY